jgi:hypothetical protein
MYEENRYDIEHIEEATRLNERSIREAIERKNKNKSKYETKFSDTNTNIEISNLKKEVMELKAIVGQIKRDDIDDLKKQIQIMLDIHKIKSDIIELKALMMK